MRNVTITLSEEVARQARIWAAEADTSVSQFLGQMLTERMERESNYRQAQADFLFRTPVTLRDAAAAYPKRDDLHDRTSLR